MMYRVRGPLADGVVVDCAPDTCFTRTSFDHRSRARLEVSEAGYVVRFQAFRNAPWTWQDVARVGREFAPAEAQAARRYFNSLALSPGYLGRIELEPEGRVEL